MLSTVALSGAHALGRCHIDRSGFDGPWTFSPTTLTNDYYKLLLDEKWQKRNWKGPPQLEDKKTKSLMMVGLGRAECVDDLKLITFTSLQLLTDYALVTDKKFRPFTEQCEYSVCRSEAVLAFLP